jgi:hypothetical protein
MTLNLSLPGDAANRKSGHWLNDSIAAKLKHLASNVKAVTLT